MIDIDPKIILVGAMISSLLMLCAMLWLIKEETETRALYFHVLDVCPCAEPEAGMLDFCRFIDVVNITEWYSHSKGTKPHETPNTTNSTGGMIGWPMNQT